ncbi:hypothetical protein V6N11_004977 [Hibiscus sabdariffa]|uniref:Uncharacterized protein n=2 Tax=Hibiscus sabdariffa TaxID=183260 RepID=A0ABR2A7P7_9ROSI
MSKSMCHTGRFMDLSDTSLSKVLDESPDIFHYYFCGGQFLIMNPSIPAIPNAPKQCDEKSEEFSVEQLKDQFQLVMTRAKWSKRKVGIQTCKRKNLLDKMTLSKGMQR